MPDNLPRNTHCAVGRIAVMLNEGYDGVVSDVLSCCVLLYALLIASLPFDDRNLEVLYKKAAKGKTNILSWLSPGAQNLIRRILDPNPATRITITEIKEDGWFIQYYILSTNHDDEELEDGFRIKDNVITLIHPSHFLVELNKSHGGSSLYRQSWLNQPSSLISAIVKRVAGLGSRILMIKFRAPGESQLGILVFSLAA
ncbi:hypothetical protein Syun_029451 [Stephania yunnanensis]|uniref:Protein kinase domain-containing protein n=1 Tax=Stephania yunnanensis TaxID=152371 RepID=A0AAP0HJH0_9MAGN